MATPIVHAGLAVIAVSVPFLTTVQYNKSRYLQYALAAAFLACLPDFDLLTSYLWAGDVRAFHFGISHSYFFAVVVALVSRLFLPARLVWWVLALVASHVVIDSLTGKTLGWHGAVEIYPWQPFTHAPMVSPVTLFRGVQHAHWFGQYNFQVVGWDMLLYGLPCLVIMGWLLLRPGKAQIQNA